MSPSELNKRAKEAFMKEINVVIDRTVYDQENPDNVDPAKPAWVAGTVPGSREADWFRIVEATLAAAKKAREDEDDYEYNARVTLGGNRHSVSDIMSLLSDMMREFGV